MSYRYSSGDVQVRLQSFRGPEGDATAANEAAAAANAAAENATNAANAAQSAAGRAGDAAGLANVARQEAHSAAGEAYAAQAAANTAAANANSAVLRADTAKAGAETAAAQAQSAAQSAITATANANSAAVAANQAESGARTAAANAAEAANQTVQATSAAQAAAQDALEAAGDANDAANRANTAAEAADANTQALKDVHPQAVAATEAANAAAATANAAAQDSETRTDAAVAAAQTATQDANAAAASADAAREAIEGDLNSLKESMDEITDVEIGENILPPDSEFGYLDIDDGITFIPNADYRCSPHMIPFVGSKIVGIVNPEITASGVQRIAAAQYDVDGNYIKTSSMLMSASGVANSFSVAEGTAFIRIWTSYNLELADICITAYIPDAFHAYTSKTYISDEAIKKPFYGKTIVNFGDSIFGNKRPPNDISTTLAELTGATVYNCGFGGCRMAKHKDSNFDAFSMYRLAYAIANNDFSVQDAVDVASVSGMPAYFEETRALLKSIGWNAVDIITIAYGTNDFTADVLLDSETDTHATNKFAGALRYSIETILAAYPHIRIFVCGQTYRFWMDDDGNFTQDSDTLVKGNNCTLLGFVEKTRDVAAEYHLPFIDNYIELGINKHNRGHYFPANDGTHHNVDGAKLIATHIAHKLF